jgi:hypothetical protein
MPKAEDQSRDQPHDTLFKAAFDDPVHASVLLRQALPEEVGRLIDWATLEHMRGSFVDAVLKNVHTDVLHRAQIDGREAFIYVLLEHQSTSPELMAKRLLGYMVRIWEKHLAKHGGTKLPGIIPVVVHHSEYGWKRSVEMSALYDLTPAALEVLRPLLPSFRFVLDDISHATDAELHDRAMKDAFGGTALYFLRHWRDVDRLFSGLLQWVDVVGAIVRAPTGVDALVSLVTYIHKVSDRSEDWVAGQLNALLAPAYKKEDIVATVYDQIAERERGKEARAMLSRQLTIKFGPMGEDVAAQIATADVETLERWAERFVTAGTIDDVLRA